MADESIKVKVGADFSEAEKAAQKSGEKISGMGKYFGDYVGSLKDKLLHGLALESIVDKSIDTMKAAFDWTKELRDTSERSGVALDSLQRLNAVGKRTGVSMETMGRMLSFANKSIGTAQVKAGDHREILTKLGFTTDQVINKEVKAEMVFQALADSYSNGADAATLQRDAQILLGRTAMQNLQIFKIGGLQMRNIMQTTNVFSDEQVRAMDRQARAYDRAGAAWEKFKRTLAYAVGGRPYAEARDLMETTQRKATISEQFSLGANAYKETDPKKIRENILKMMGEKGYKLEDMQDIFGKIENAKKTLAAIDRGETVSSEAESEARHIQGSRKHKMLTKGENGEYMIGGNEAGDKAFTEAMKDIISKMTPTRKDEQLITEGVAKGTSLQAVGGGDWITATTLSATERTANATEASHKELASINQKVTPGNNTNKTNIAK
jgi:hypothetical protein